ncbi:Lysosome membrane protein 2 [Zootermopsis nevadensis]|uniref:Lysosome membrane protein 2 n=1 Tax=Zootermopsis nevadensis TaxID=136037 RepID=A0A067RK50_ZOONE|nr:Lysosome membrane protein 2 [Zootermopsis nevadensis]
MIMGTALNVRRNFGPDLSMDPFLKEISPVSESIFLTATVRKLFWDGVTVINCTGDKLSSDAEMICGVLTPHLPVVVSEHEPGIFKMAYFRHKNASSNGRIRVNTGISDSRALARIEEWNGQPNLMTWSGEYCNSINGTDSTIFPPFWSPKDTVAIFEVELCRYTVSLLN